MRIATTTFFLLACQALVAQQVSVGPFAMTVQDAVAKIGQASGTPMKADPVFGGQSLFIAAKDVEVEVLMAKVAEATRGTWVRESGTTMLRPDKAKIKSEADARAASFRAKVEGSLKKFLESQDGLKSWDRAKVKQLVDLETERLDKMLEQITSQTQNQPDAKLTVMLGSSKPNGPAGVALVKLLESMGAGPFTNLQEGERRVFSSLPTRMQKAFPVPTGPVLSEFAKAHELLASVSEGALDKWPGVTVRGGLELGQRPFKGEYGKVILVAKRPEKGDGVSLSLSFYDQKGAQVGQSKLWLDGQYAAPVEPMKGLSSDSKLVLSELGRETAAAYQKANSEGNENNQTVLDHGGAIFVAGFGSILPQTGLSDAALEYFTLASGAEPGSTFINDALSQLAKDSGANVVAAVPYSLVPFLGAKLASAQKSSDVARLFADRGLATKSGDGWVVMNLAADRSQEPGGFDRTAFNSVLAGSVRQGYTRLGDLFKLVNRMGDAASNRHLAFKNLEIIDPYSSSTISYSIQQMGPLLKFLGSLNASVYQPSAEQFSVPVSAMNSAQRGHLNELTYNRDMFGSIMGEGEMIGVMMNVGDTPGDEPIGPSLMDEPTEKYADGIPPTGTVTLKFTPGERAFGKVKDAPTGRFYSAMALAMQNHFGEAAASEGAASAIPPMDLWVQANGYILEVSTSFIAVATGHFEDGWMTGSATLGEYGSLPESFRNAVLAGIEDLKKNSMQFEFGGNRRTPPPQQVGADQAK